MIAIRGRKGQNGSILMNIETNSNMVIDSSPKIKEIKNIKKVVNGGKKGQKGAKWPSNNKILVPFEWTYKPIITSS